MFITNKKIIEFYRKFNNAELMIAIISLIVSTVTASSIAMYQVGYTKSSDEEKAIIEVRSSIYDLVECIKIENEDDFLATSDSKCSASMAKKNILKHGDHIDLSNDKFLEKIYRSYRSNTLIFAAIHLASILEKSDSYEAFRLSILSMDKYLERINSQHARLMSVLLLCNFIHNTEAEIRLEDIVYLFPESWPLKSPSISFNFMLNRVNPVTGSIRNHPGIDFSGIEGTPVYSAFSGVISYIGSDSENGIAIEIKNSNNERVRVYYAHLQKFTDNFTIGSIVKSGQQIGYIGNTGRSTGPHLHYEWRIGGKQLPPPMITQGLILRIFADSPHALESNDKKELQRLLLSD
jgi:murein DD-endopeptidase MepM/ murein hydrolase activator NlpD